MITSTGMAGAEEIQEAIDAARGAKTPWQALGQLDYGRKSSEQGNVQFRRSLYFVKDLKAGGGITEDAVRSVRPGFGLPPIYLKSVVGKALKLLFLRRLL